MEERELVIQIDLQSFGTCQFCLRVVPIIVLQGYLVYLLVRELIRTNKGYDRMDKVVFVISVVLLGTDLFSTLMLQVAISDFSHVVRVVWSLALYFIFLRFIFQNKQCSKLFITSFLFLLAVYIFTIKYHNLVPVRYTILILYIMIGLCGLHQILYIRQIEGNQRARKKSMNLFLNRSKKKELEIQLLQKKDIVEYRVISSQFKYHIKLRKSFCIAVMSGCAINYFFLWDLAASRQSIGEFFVIFMVELLLPLIYYFYTTVNQWIIEQLNNPNKEEDPLDKHTQNQLSQQEMV